MGRVRGRDWVKSIFLDSNVDPGSTNYVDPGTCLTWQNHGDRIYLQLSLQNTQSLLPASPQPLPPP